MNERGRRSSWSCKFGWKDNQVENENVSASDIFWGGVSDSTVLPLSATLLSEALQLCHVAQGMNSSDENSSVAQYNQSQYGGACSNVLHKLMDS